MAFGFFSRWLLFQCAVTCVLLDSVNTLQQSSILPQVPIVVECKTRSLFISLDIPPSGSEPRFEAVDARGAYPVTESYGAQCGYTYSVQPLLGRVVLRASYFSCHTDNQNDEVFTFMFGVFIMDQSGTESFFNVSQTCSVPPFSPREVTCEENYMEVSVRTDLPCPTAGSIKDDFSAAYAVAQSSAVEAWQVILQQEGQQSAVMSTEDAATLGYFIMATPGRLVFRTTFGQPYSSVKMVNNVAVEVIQATVFFRQNWMVVMVDLVAACSLDEGSFDGYRLHWRTPAVMTPLVVGPSELRSEYIGMGVDGEVVDEQAATDRGYSVTVSEETVDSSIPYAAEGGIRKSFVMDNVYNELYMVQLTYQQTFVDQRGVVTKHNVVRQMATPPIPRPPFSVNQTTLEERVFQVYLGNIPFDVELVSVELNGQEISVLTAAQMGYSITRVSEENNTFAYIIRVPFEDQFVVKQYVSEGFFEYSLEIKWTLNIMPQMEAYYHFSSVSAFIIDALPPVFDSMCADNGISFMKDHQQYDYLWDIGIGSYTLTPQLASERGYILTNDSTTLILDVPLFTIGYIYEDITLQQFYGTFELLTKNAKTLAIEQSSSKRCLFQTTELLVCSTDGVMTVVSDITKAVPSADPARTTLLDQSCRPQETDETRVLFSFGLNTCGTRFQIDQQYVTYENEIIFHELYSTDTRPVITRDAAYRVTVRCIYPVRGIESLFVDRRFAAETPGIGQMKDPVKVPPQMLKPMQPQKQTIMKPSFQLGVARKPADYARVGQWTSPLDEYAQWSLGPNGGF
ncbi:zona pellucida protein AX 4 isoform X2 [Labeo rohita]|uniref:zona pellucida protein AX 4 isoform X2 n=1 Tax=Labeo rohita TaxID=84645 RepID=UPI0021E201C6|nr:zona pellucida protein AX 4 isoform X2 [Labeo rohita]